MSASPPKTDHDAEPGAQSGDEAEHMDREQEGAQQGLIDFEVKEQDRWLPIANVARIMKTALPENAKIAKEAKECMQECVSEFISFITSEASEKCQQEKRKTVNGEDVLFAMTSLGFENYAEALKIYLTKYRETQSARGETTNPPEGASEAPPVGYPAGGTVAGPTSSANATGPPAAAGSHPSAVFHPPQSETTGPILSSANALDGAEHDSSGPYAYSGITSTGHNGTSAESY